MYSTVYTEALSTFFLFFLSNSYFRLNRAINIVRVPSYFGRLEGDILKQIGLVRIIKLTVYVSLYIVVMLCLPLLLQCYPSDCVFNKPPTCYDVSIAPATPLEASDGGGGGNASAPVSIAVPQKLRGTAFAKAMVRARERDGASSQSSGDSAAPASVESPLARRARRDRKAFVLNRAVRPFS